ncbi:hypothetical protein D3C80_1556280 [compost metagenome]
MSRSFEIVEACDRMPTDHTLFRCLGDISVALQVDVRPSGMNAGKSNDPGVVPSRTESVDDCRIIAINDLITVRDDQLLIEIQNIDRHQGAAQSALRRVF